MPSAPVPDQLRARARALRHLATRIECTPAMSLDRHAGDDTWRTPRADLARSILRANQAQLHHAVDELRWTAYRLELQAVDVETERLHGSWSAS
jgi:hypothetical protein